MGNRLITTFVTLSLVSTIMLSLIAAPVGVVEAAGTTVGPDYDKFEVTPRYGSESGIPWATPSGSFTQTVGLPWAFDFYGTLYQEISISRAGIATFDIGTSYENGGRTVQQFDEHPAIAPAWTDLPLQVGAIDVASDISWFRVVWEADPGAGATRNFAMVLYADGRIRFDYAADNAGDGGLTGITSGASIKHDVYTGSLIQDWTESVLYRPKTGVEPSTAPTFDRPFGGGVWVDGTLRRSDESVPFATVVGSIVVKAQGPVGSTLELFAGGQSVKVQSPGGGKTMLEWAWTPSTTTSLQTLRVVSTVGALKSSAFVDVLVVDVDPMTSGGAALEFVRPFEGTLIDCSSPAQPTLAGCPVEVGLVGTSTTCAEVRIFVAGPARDGYEALRFDKQNSFIPALWGPQWVYLGGVQSLFLLGDNVLPFVFNLPDRDRMELKAEAIPCRSSENFRTVRTSPLFAVDSDCTHADIILNPDLGENWYTFAPSVNIGQMYSCFGRPYIRDLQGIVLAQIDDFDATGRWVGGEDESLETIDKLEGAASLHIRVPWEGITMANLPSLRGADRVSLWAKVAEDLLPQERPPEGWQVTLTLRSAERETSATAIATVAGWTELVITDVPDGTIEVRVRLADVEGAEIISQPWRRILLDDLRASASRFLEDEANPGASPARFEVGSLNYPLPLPSISDEYVFLDLTNPTGTPTFASATGWIAVGNPALRTATAVLNLNGVDGQSGLDQLLVVSDDGLFQYAGPYVDELEVTFHDVEMASASERTVTVRYTDRAGRASEQRNPPPVSIDPNPPRFVGAGSPDASWQGLAALTASVGVMDAESGVAPDGMMQVLNAGGGTQTFPWVLVDDRAVANLAGLVTGAHTMRWFVRDVAGNQATADLPLRIDVTPPTSPLVNIVETNTSHLTVRVRLNAIDPHSQVAGVRYGEDKDTAVWLSHPGIAIEPEFDLTPGDGKKTVYGQFRDGVGNVGAWAQDTVILDTRPPALTSWAPQGDGVPTYPVEVRATWDDDRSVTNDVTGVHSDVRIWWYDRNLNQEIEITELPTMNRGPNGFTYNPGILQANNEYRVTVQLKDGAGNVAQDQYWGFWT